MNIKGTEYEFYCAKCKGLVNDYSSERIVAGKTYCSCSPGSQTGKTEKKYNGIRFNKE